MTLDRLIALHRSLYRDDTLIDRLVARQPPTSLDLNTGILHEELATQVGMNMSGRLLKYVGHPEGYGADFPWSKAFWLLRSECRRRHFTHRAAERPYWRGSLCYEAVKLTVIGGRSLSKGPLSPEQAAEILKVDDLTQVLTGAFRIIEEAMDRQRERAEKRNRADEGYGPGAVPAPVYEQRHDMGGLHAAECPKCRRNVA